MLNEREINESQPENVRKTIAELKLANANLLIQEDIQSTITFSSIDPLNRGLDYIKATRHLPQSSILELEKVDAGKLIIGNSTSIPPSIRLTERVSGIDESTVTIHATDGKKVEKVPLDIDIYENELLDLFGLQNGSERNATFFTVDTSTHDIIGIALKRDYPVILAITHGRDGDRFSSLEGVLGFLNGVYDRFFENRSPFQKQIDEAIFKEMAPGGDIKFKGEATTHAQRRQRDIQKRIYQIQALLLARKAENGEQLDDPNLKNHVPFIPTSVSQPDTSIVGRIFNNRSSVTSQASSVVLDNSIWTSLISNLTDECLVNSRSQWRQTVTQRNHTMVQPSHPRPAPNVQQMTVPQSQVSESMNRPIFHVQPTVNIPESMTKNDQLEEAKSLSREVNIQLLGSLGFLREISLDSVGMVDVFKFNTHLATAAEKTKMYIDKRKNGVPTASTVTAHIIPRDGMITVAGLNGEGVGAFLTGKNEETYINKVASALSMWNSHVKPFYSEIFEVNERKLSALKSRGRMYKLHPSESLKIASQLIHLLKDQEGLVTDDVNAAELSHFLLSSQVLYSLREQYKELLRRGKAEDFDQWASFTYISLNRLKQLVPSAIADGNKLTNG